MLVEASTGLEREQYLGHLGPMKQRDLAMTVTRRCSSALSCFRTSGARRRGRRRRTVPRGVYAVDRWSQAASAQGCGRDQVSVAESGTWIYSCALPYLARRDAFRLQRERAEVHLK